MWIGNFYIIAKLKKCVNFLIFFNKSIGFVDLIHLVCFRQIDILLSGCYVKYKTK
jgi:hypothetical protein